jgi:hypothetical protein
MAASETIQIETYQKERTKKNKHRIDRGTASCLGGCRFKPQPGDGLPDISEDHIASIFRVLGGTGKAEAGGMLSLVSPRFFSVPPSKFRDGN